MITETMTIKEYKTYLNGLSKNDLSYKLAVLTAQWYNNKPTVLDIGIESKKIAMVHLTKEEIIDKIIIYKKRQGGK